MPNGCAKTANRVRLIAVHPYAGRTRAFIAAMCRQPGLQVEVHEAPALPSFAYNYYSYQPIDWSRARAGQIYQEHLEYYVVQLQRAKEKAQHPLLVTGRLHELDAPYFTALRQVYGIDPAMDVYDMHLDCSAPDFASGCHVRWMVTQGFIDPRRIRIIGLGSRYDYDAVPYQEIAHAYLSGPGKVLLSDDITVNWLEVAREQAPKLLRWQTLTPGEQKIELRILQDALMVEAERMWLIQRGIFWVYKVTDILPGSDRLVSFDGDVAERIDLAKLEKYLEHTSQTGRGWPFVCELDSPKCSYPTEALAALFGRHFFLHLGETSESPLRVGQEANKYSA